MSDLALHVENLGKKYRLGVTHQGTLREALHHLGRKLLGARSMEQGARSNTGSAPRPSLPAPRSRLPASPNGDFWALRNVSFEVRRGEVLGVIGRNGAGKSTLLKILSRVTTPTTGRATIHGRVGSLLEVGTGFHPELTGRENVYLNGAILGMTKREIDDKFDEIVDFAGVEKFIDTPVKRYSSGMHVRLGFAVAAHLEPEVLIVDEVLAVGDAEFQKRCLGRMEDVAKGGRTVLFVSHNMTAISSLCSRVLLLGQGELLADGPADEVTSRYVEHAAADSGEMIWASAEEAPGTAELRLHAVRIRSAGRVTGQIDIHQEFFIDVEFWNLRAHTRVWDSIHLLDGFGGTVFCSGTAPVNQPVGLFRSTYTIPGDFLNDGAYSLRVFLLRDMRIEVKVDQPISFTVFEPARDSEYLGKVLGVVRPRLATKTEPIRAEDAVSRTPG